MTMTVKFAQGCGLEYGRCYANVVKVILAQKDLFRDTV